MAKCFRVNSECLESCRSLEHAKEIICCITLKNIDDHQLATYIYNICAGLKQQVNGEGCSPLHMAAACGRLELCRWLIKAIHADINKPDLESSFTPLHKSVFYGQLHNAVELIRLGADMLLPDKDGLLPLDHALVDLKTLNDWKVLIPQNVSVWGSNNNYILGIGSQSSRSHPTVLEFFRSQKIIIKKVCMDKFHSVFLSTEGKVWAAGHGLGGRLGLSSEQTALEPQQVLPQSNEVFKMISIGRDHTVLLAESNSIYSFGLNTYHQLGVVPPVSKVVLPHRLNFSKNYKFLGVVAARFHSLFWTKTSIFCCGLHAGQLGLEWSSNPTIADPTLITSIPVKSGCEITHVVASTGASVVVTSLGEVYALHEFKTVKISSRLNEIVGNVQKIAIVGGHIDSGRAQLKMKSDIISQDLKIAILGDNSVFIWTEMHQNFARCLHALKVPMKIVDIHFNLSNLLMASDFGVVFSAPVKSHKTKKTPEKKKLQTSRLFPKVKLDGSVVLNLSRVPHLFRVISVTSDPEGENFAVLQKSTSNLSKNTANLAVPVIKSELPMLMSDLLSETSEDDLIHDVVFEIGNKRFAAHRVIVSKASKKLWKLMESLPHDEKDVHLTDVDPLIFSEILEFMYTDSCSLLIPGKFPERFLNKIKTCSSYSPLNLLQETADKFEILELSRKLKSYRTDKNGLTVCRSKDKEVKKVGYQMEFSDFQIIQKGGLLALKKRKHENDCELDLSKFEKSNRYIATDLYLDPEFTAFKYFEVQESTNDFGKELYFVTESSCKSRLSRHEFPRLFDVEIETSDRCIVKAHKCILISRVEYFRCMLSGSWREMSSMKSIRLPFPKALVESLLDYIYMERVFKSFADPDASDFYKCLLIAANYMLLPNLKEICEFNLSNLLTLKNVVPLLQVSALHSANRLRHFCLNFICYNIAELLDLRYLEPLSLDLLEDLSSLYREMNPNMCWRHITPSSAISNSQILEFNRQCPLVPWNFFEDNDDFNVLTSPKSLESKSTCRKKLPSRIRRISASESKVKKEQIKSESPSSNSSISEDLSNFLKTVIINSEDSQCFETNSKSKDGEWIKIEKQQKSVQSRLKVNSMVKSDPSVLDSGFCKMTELVPRSDPISIPKPVERHSDSSPILLQDVHMFPSLGSSPHSSLSVGKFNHSPRPSESKKIKFKRRVLSCGEIVIEGKKVGDLQKSPVSPSCSESPASPKNTSDSPKSPWGMIHPSNVSLEEVMKNEQISCPTSKEPTMNFCDIIADEQRRRDNLERMKSKPLTLIQMEDRAIEDLLVFYNAKNCFDEHITVQRVIETNIAAPTWITHR